MMMRMMMAVIHFITANGKMEGARVASESAVCVFTVCTSVHFPKPGSHVSVVCA